MKLRDKYENGSILSEKNMYFLQSLDLGLSDKFQY